MNQGFTNKQKSELSEAMAHELKIQIPLIVGPIIENKLGEALKPIEKDIRKLNKDMKIVINFFDRETIDLDKRVLRVENHLNLPPIQ